MARDRDRPWTKPQKQKNNSLDLLSLRPQSKSQEAAFDAFNAGDNLLMIGPAGVGKTIIAMYLALREVIARRMSRLVIVRSALPSRDIGFMPGNLHEKTSLYEAPYADACSFLYGRDDAYYLLKNHHQVEFLTTSFVRGITVRDAVIFVDEASNMSYHENDSIITRAGEGTRIIICGDKNQSDLVKSEDRQGFTDVCRVLREMKSFKTVEFSIADVRRSELVREYLETRNKILKW
jgi:phosphate starvation-inducible protein PhoH